MKTTNRAANRTQLTAASPSVAGSLLQSTRDDCSAPPHAHPLPGPVLRNLLARSLLCYIVRVPPSSSCRSRSNPHALQAPSTSPALRSVSCSVPVSLPYRGPRHERPPPICTRFTRIPPYAYPRMIERKIAYAFQTRSASACSAIDGMDITTRRVPRNSCASSVPVCAPSPRENCPCCGL